MSFYLDTSVVVPLFLNEENSFIAKSYIGSTREPLVYSHLVAGELNSAISRHERMGVLSVDQAETIREGAATWLQSSVFCAAIDDEDIETASRLVAHPRPKLLMPDAIHLLVCARLSHTLVTFDTDLLAIARREGIAAVMPE